MRNGPACMAPLARDAADAALAARRGDPAVGVRYAIRRGGRPPLAADGRRRRASMLPADRAVGLAPGRRAAYRRLPQAARARWWPARWG
ncbi:hypothetical protein M8494_04740 [Serratia ureilytica]